MIFRRGILRVGRGKYWSVLFIISQRFEQWCEVVGKVLNDAQLVSQRVQGHAILRLNLSEELDHMPSGLGLVLKLRVEAIEKDCRHVRGDAALPGDAVGKDIGRQGFERRSR